MTGAAPRLRLVGEGSKACSCRDITGEITCSECSGMLVLVHPRELLARDAEREALRHLVAALLVEERESLRSPDSPSYTHRIVDVAEAIQTARDVCAAMPRGAR